MGKKYTSCRKDGLKFPNYVPYDKDGKDSMIKYIREFEKENALKRCPVKIGEKTYD